MAQAGIFIVFFIFGFGVFRVLTDVIWDPDADFGGIANKVAAVVCGLITGLIISGVVLVAVAMTPTAARWPYARFGDGEAAIRDVQSAKGPLISADGLVSGLFSWMSKGSLSSSRSFAVYHTGYLDQLHLNKYKAKAGVYRIAGKDAISVPKKGLRRLDADNESLTIVRMEVKRGDIKAGGQHFKGRGLVHVGSGAAGVQEASADNTRGAGTAVYPQGALFRDDWTPKTRARADRVDERQRGDGVHAR